MWTSCVFGQDIPLACIPLTNTGAWEYGVDSDECKKEMRARPKILERLWPCMTSTKIPYITYIPKNHTNNQLFKLPL